MLLVRALLLLLFAFCGSCRPNRTDEATLNAEDILNIRVRKCGEKLDDLLAKICNGEFSSPLDDEPKGADTNRRYKRQIVDECCRNRCTYRQLGAYCRHSNITSRVNKLISNDLREHMSEKVKSESRPATKGHEDYKVSRMGKPRARVERDKKITGVKSFISQCLYESFANFLRTRKARKRRGGKLNRRKTAGFQVGTVAPLNLGGRPTLVMNTSG